jgi:uncharacterized protein
VRDHPLISYFVLAYAISWAIVAPLIASAQGFTDVPVPFALHYLNDYGPLLAALITAGIANGTAGLRDLFRRIIKWRVGLGAGRGFFAVSGVRDRGGRGCYRRGRPTARL